MTIESLRMQEMREDAFVEGAARYLDESGARGISKVLAYAIANHFKYETYEVCLNRPEELLAVKDIGKKRAKELNRWFQLRFGEDVPDEVKRENVRECGLLTTLYAIGMSNWEVMQVRNHFGDDDVLQIIKENPYRLTEVERFGFTKSDKVAQAIGYDLHDPRRIAAGVVYTLDKKANDGHCCMPIGELSHEAGKELHLYDAEIQPVIEEMTKDGRLDDSMDCIYLPKYHNAEWTVARCLADMIDYSLPCAGVGDIMADVKAYNDILNAEQLAAIRSVLEKGVTVLTGGPGTGKTTTLRGMIKAIQRAGWTFALCAPTGMAQKRMGESSGSPAQTIHRLLGYNGEEFKYDIDNPLPYDVIICDEASMVDILLMEALLNAMRDGARLVLIGDNDQLPSVGPGRVLGDIIDSGIASVIYLRQIYRQTNSDDEVSIINNARRIISGQLPAIDNPNSKEFYFKDVGEDVDNKGKTPEERAQEALVYMVKKRVPDQWPDYEVQVLTPNRKDGLNSVNTLNPILQDALNPYGEPLKRRFGGEFRNGDRVMQTKNNYMKNIYNGDVGCVKNVNSEFDMLSVDFGYDNLTNYYDDPKKHELDELSLAYVSTIHKSQGSEYDIVIIMLMPSAGRMLRRNLLYTAITRAKKVCIIIGNKKALEKAVKDNYIEPRHTKLKERLQYEKGIYQRAD